MKCSDITNGFPIFFLLLITACGGGGGGGSSAPAPTPTPSPMASASDDTAATLEDTRIDIAVTNNDTNVNTATLSIAAPPSNGTAEVIGPTIRYTPAANFSGNDELSYQISGSSGETLNASVAITVTAITETRLVTAALEVPNSGYTSQNNPELGANILVSPLIEFTIAPNPVSIAVALTGSDVNDTNSTMFIAEVVGPNGISLNPLERRVTFCDPGYCSALLPRRPDQDLIQGSWALRVGTRASSLAGIDLAGINLTIAQRIGPEPVLSDNPILRVRPFLTATSVTESDLELVLAQLTAMALASNLELVLDAIEVVNDPAFSEVPREFSDPQTAALVSMGAADRINLFFLEDFSGTGASGLLGISGGIPGPLGSANEFNGVLINASANRSSSNPVFARNTAEIALHELGHFLGLYHTTERQFEAHDVLEDTPECTDVSDSSSTGIQGVADIAECSDGQNLMFWNSDFSGNKQPLSEDQREIIVRSPIAIPGS